jgi:type I restriction enzyme S subunit
MTMLRFRTETQFYETAIGSIPKDWKQMAVGNCVTWEKDSINPQHSPNEVFYLYSIPSYDSGRIPKRVCGREIGSNKILVETGQILFSKLNPRFPRIWMITENSSHRKIASTEFLCLTPRKAIVDTSYLEKVLSSDFFIAQVSETVGGTTGSRERLKQEVILETLIPYPPTLPEQSSIAAILSRFDELIENKMRQNGILEAAALAVFRNWFVDFEPFKYQGLVDSALGKIPTGWQVKPIGDLADLRNGLSYSGSEKYDEPVEGSYVFITLNNVVEGGGFKTEYAWIKSDRISEQHFLDEGDLFLTNTHFGVGGAEVERLLATPALVIFPNGYAKTKGVCSHHITKILPYNPNHRLFLYLFLKVTREDSVSFATGTGVLGLDMDNFKKNKMVPCPPEPILEKFVSIVEPLFEKMTVNKKQIMTLREVRNALLRPLLFGRLRVEET